MALSRRKFVAFAATTVLLAFGLMLGGLLAADVYLHAKAERSAGLNRAGYRGPVAGAKRPGERRVVMLGGSTVFGYGVLWNEALPAVLERLLNEILGDGAVRMVNLGYNGEGAYAMLPTLEDFEYLGPDVVCLYPGDTDLMGDAGPNTAVYRHTSAVFRLTGYFPILPLALTEKAMALRSGGHLGEAYASLLENGKPKPVFQPSLSQRASAAALDAVASLTNTMGRQLDRVSAVKAPEAGLRGPQRCDAPWIHYCDAVFSAIQYALQRGRPVVVMSAPLGSDGDGRARQLLQQAALAGLLARNFENDPRVTFVDLSRAVDPSDPALAFDGNHLTSTGNLIVAKTLVEPVRRATNLRTPSP